MQIKVVRQILEWNEDKSREIQELLSQKKVCLINVLGSPGAGKTSLITALIGRLRQKYRIGVIEGDIAGQIDAERIQSLGLPVVQLQTDGACHIEAMSIQHILSQFDLDALDVIFIENIGNLVCPAEFNIGEDFRISLLSVPEGDDKVEKYPLIFATTDALVLNKFDMLPYFEFDDAKVERQCVEANPKATVFRVSTRGGEGLPELVQWLQPRIDAKL